MYDFFELEEKFQQITSDLDFDYVYPSSLLPASQDAIAQAIFDFASFSITKNTHARFKEMALQNAEFSMQKLAMFSTQIKEKTLLADAPISVGAKLLDQHDTYLETLSQLSQTENKPLTNVVTPQPETMSHPTNDDREGISFTAYLVGMTIIITICLVVREFNY